MTAVAAKYEAVISMSRFASIWPPDVWTRVVYDCTKKYKRWRKMDQIDGGGALLILETLGITERQNLGAQMSCGLGLSTEHGQ